MNAEMVIKAAPAAQNVVKDNGKGSVFWKIKLRDKTESAVAGLQLSIDKSHEAMSVRSSHFYPLHTKLLKFTKKYV